MKRLTLYSSSRSSMTGRVTPTNHPDQSPDQAHGSPSAQVASRQPRFSWQNFYTRHERLLWVAAAGLLSLLLLFIYAAITPSRRQITQDDIRAALLRSLEINISPQPARMAYDVLPLSLCLG